MPELDTRAPNLPGLLNKGSYTVLTLTFIYVASGVCAVGLFAYLGYALIRAENF
ncbi:K(+)-transporting ATPase subunit F [Pseudomonas fluorescens]|uniref:K(+)-transporting ATPase subunit F n=1 Tax=Pseudomonas fluorescens TaxID=294 RepID=UPI003CD00BDC